jgi:hypothetical protein
MDLNASLAASGAFRHLSRPLAPGESIPSRPSLLAQLGAFSTLPREAAAIEDALDESAEDFDTF